MDTVDGGLILSPSDLVGFLACGHLASLEIAAARGTLVRPSAEGGGLAATYGDRHERRYLETLISRGFSVAEIPRPGRSRAALEAAEQATYAAMEAGVDVVYQACFFDGEWVGYADFLLKDPTRPAAAWPWSYDLIDTKLARHARASALVQLASYCEHVARLQGSEPRLLRLVLGDDSEQDFAPRDVTAYFRSLRRRFRAALAAEDPPYPLPVHHCAICRWDAHCRRRRHEDDHVCLVAGIRRVEVQRLEAAGVGTVRALAARSPELSKVRIGPDSLERLTAQAAEQVATREAGELTATLRPRRPGTGLDRLPEASDGDVFFDMEGFPFAPGGNLEYLFGWVGADGRFDSLLALDRRAERQAFEAFVDTVVARRAAYPAMHVYHYAHYEAYALSRLAATYGTREEEVDRLLRSGCLVDLYRIVREAVVVGAESYSIKTLEPLYGLRRDGEVHDAGESLVGFERFLESGDRSFLEEIVVYNEADCRSTLALRDWLAARRLEAPGAIDAEPSSDKEATAGDGGAPKADLAAWLEETARRHAALTAAVGEEATRSAEQAAVALLGHLLYWHRREEAADYREQYARLGQSVDELREVDERAIGDLTYVGSGGEVKQSELHVYTFPVQDSALFLGSTPIDPDTWKGAGRIVEIEPMTTSDVTAGRIVLRRAKKSRVPHPRALLPPWPVRTDGHKAALAALADWVIENGIASHATPYRAARQLLCRAAPRLSDRRGGELARPGEDGTAAVRRLCGLLDHATLGVQGPPGSGKTTTAVEVILDAVGRGEKVGVTANSHRVITNLLESLWEKSAAQHRPVSILQRRGEGDAAAKGAEPAADNATVLARLADVDVVGGTSWLFTDASLAGSFDLLVVDEAGQMSLANVLACARSARNLVLFGDPAQLDQPTKAAHPKGAECSALGHLLGENQTMPPELGVFLEDTHRLHPAICGWVSEVVYEGRLQSDPACAHQRVFPPDDGEPDDGPVSERLFGSGIRYLPVLHGGNRTSSLEEAEAVRAAVEEILGRSWQDREQVRRELTAADVLVVTPYNAQVATLRRRVPDGVEVGTVDKFQGRQAAVVFYSMATSTLDDAPRGLEFLYSLNRLNVAVSRARALAVLVASPALLAPRCSTPEQVRLVNALCRLAEHAGFSGETRPS